MKLGIRTPSLTKRIAARTSVRRYVRHSLGLKAPRGAGWFTNPQRAAYNRVYDRTTVSADRLLRSRRRRLHDSGSDVGSGSLVGLAIVAAPIVFLIWLFRAIV